MIALNMMPAAWIFGCSSLGLACSVGGMTVAAIGGFFVGKTHGIRETEARLLPDILENNRDLEAIIKAATQGPR